MGDIMYSKYSKALKEVNYNDIHNYRKGIEQKLIKEFNEKNISIRIRPCFVGRANIKFIAELTPPLPDIVSITVPLSNAIRELDRFHDYCLKRLFQL